MAEQAILDKAYHVVLQRFIDTGRAPHYTEMAAELGMPPEAGRQLLHDLMEAGLPAIWLHPGTDRWSRAGALPDTPRCIGATVDV